MYRPRYNTYIGFVYTYIGLVYTYTGLARTYTDLAGAEGSGEDGEERAER